MVDNPRATQRLPDSTTTPEQAALDAYWAAKTPAEVRAAVERLTALGMWKGEGPMPRLMRKEQPS